MRIRQFFIVLFIYNLISCTVDKTKNNSGIVNVKLQIFDTITSTNLRSVFANEYRIWYKDSIAIEEINLNRFITDTAGKQSTEVVIMHYAFIDLRSNSYYYYKTFSDTARSFKKYTGVDSFAIDGGWNFYTERNIEFSGSPVNLDDTTIGQIKYKRIKFNTQKGKNNYVTIGYFRCDKKKSMFKFDKAYSEILGCPLVKIYDFPTGKGNPMSAEIIFISDTLSKEELNVFDVWEKNLKKYPVIK